MVPTDPPPIRARKARDFSVHQAEPFNGEPPLTEVARTPITPTSLFFVRNHAPVPSIDPDRFALRIGGLVKRERAWAMGELRDSFRETEVTATLHCAGNRRQELMAIRAIPGEVGWACAAVGTAVWRGVRLADLLEEVGVHSEAAHVELVGADRIEKEGEAVGFGGSIPLDRAMESSVLLAFEMNGEPLPPEHGFPLRAVVPGSIGARSVKWLERIHVRSTPSENYYQARSYRLFPSDVTAETADWSRAPSIGELALNSVITEPAPGSLLRLESPPSGAGSTAGAVTVRGYAIAGGNRRVDRVEVSADGGEEWVEARLEGEPAPGMWCLWHAEVPVEEGGEKEIELVARAFDSDGNGQPADVEPLWNFKGYMNNAWHRVRVTLD